MTTPPPSRKSSGDSIRSGCSILPTISSDPHQYSTQSGRGQSSISKPQCIGEFSLDKSRHQQLGRSQVRYLYEPVINKKISANLADGIAKFVAKDCDEGIDQLLRWIATMGAPGSSLKKTIHECDFVIWRGTLTRLMTSSYDVNPYAVGVKVACVKYRGIYFIREYDTHAKSMSEATRSDYQRRMCYGGFKFEQIVTVDEPGQKPDTEAPVDQNNEFIGMFKATLNSVRPIKRPLPNGTPWSAIVAAPSPSRNSSSSTPEPSIRLLYGAEIDCISPMGHYLEVKTQYKSFGSGKGFGNKALKWWLQSYLVGIKDIVVGLQENCVLNRVELHPVDGLSKYFEGDGADSTVCFTFLQSLLQTVRRYLDEAAAANGEGDGAILVVERAPNSHEFKFQLVTPDCEAAAEYRVLSEQFKAHGWR